MSNLFYGIAFGLAAALFVGWMDKKDQETQEDYYCQMVALHKQDPSRGWPDYRKIYTQTCLKTTR